QCTICLRLTSSLEESLVFFPLFPLWRASLLPWSIEEPEEKSKDLPEWSEKVAHNILSGASWVSWGLVKVLNLLAKQFRKVLLNSESA
ncbi:hypothetical protein OFM13_31250, partial [Escherichia coli]|nr:hypothetical protein [Escherichia coli]